LSRFLIIGSGTSSLWARLLLENFVLFSQSENSIKKILPRYFQYLGVNRAFDNVVNRNKLQGKIGVFWHTQGSGKSFSMVYLSQKVLRKLDGNFTFVIVTDRKDLDRQAYKNFATVGAVYESEVHAESITHLRELLSADNRQIFTTIQKFQDISDVVSNRNDIIIMTDEAHRSQYDTYAMNMRLALPNASFIGFTGTPLMSDGEEKTRETFGEYVSEYNFADSVKDGATICIPKGVARCSRLLAIALSARSFGASSEITAHDCAFRKILP
jgi:type I restriction enzyme R subunit